MKRAATAALLVLLASLALATAQTPGQSTTGQTGRYSAPAPNSVGSQGGNVTEVNVSSDASTDNWQGFWGNVTGSLRLGDGTDTFYDWTGVQFSAVYASPDADVDWSTVSGLATTAEKEGKDGDYGFDSSKPDSINQTMSGNTCGAGTQISSAAGVTPYNSSGQPGSWTTCLGEDGGATITDTVLGTDIVMGGADAYNGRKVQYQLMVPVNSTGNNYYLYLEI